MKFIVTVKLPRNKDHDPHNKQEGTCPATASKYCTDTTGEHHSFLLEAGSLLEAKTTVTKMGFSHTTRIETV